MYSPVPRREGGDGAITNALKGVPTATDRLGDGLPIVSEGELRSLTGFCRLSRRGWIPRTSKGEDASH